jgi:hypothetical protein
MAIRTRFSISADGYVTTPDGWPSLAADPAFVPGQSHGWREFQAGCEAVRMGRLLEKVIPIFLGDGRRLTETVSLHTKVTLEEARPLPEGAVDIVYGVA